MILVASMTPSIILKVSHVLATHRKMYWTEEDDNNLGIIVSGGMDGSGLKPLVKEGLQHPTSIIADVHFGLYWVDSTRHDIEHGAIEKEKIWTWTFVPSSYDNYRPVHLSASRGKLYCAGVDGNLSAVFRANLLYHSGVEDYVRIANFTSHINGLCIFDTAQEVREGRANPCASGSSCPGICLLSGRSSFRCVCPVGLELNGSSCVGVFRIL